MVTRFCCAINFLYLSTSEFLRSLISDAFKLEKAESADYNLLEFSPFSTAVSRHLTIPASFDVKFRP